MIIAALGNDHLRSDVTRRAAFDRYERDEGKPLAPRVEKLKSGEAIVVIQQAGWLPRYFGWLAERSIGRALWSNRSIKHCFGLRSQLSACATLP